MLRSSRVTNMASATLKGGGGSIAQITGGFVGLGDDDDDRVDVVPRKHRLLSRETLASSPRLCYTKD
jgi:hypothetical protein